MPVEPTLQEFPPDCKHQPDYLIGSCQQRQQQERGVLFSNYEKALSSPSAFRQCEGSANNVGTGDRDPLHFVQHLPFRSNAPPRQTDVHLGNLQFRAPKSDVSVPTTRHNRPH